MSNPALTSTLIWQFARSYSEKLEIGPPVALCFVILPIVMSRRTRETFTGTNISTGFLTWLARHPELTLNLAKRVMATRDLTREALRFGIAYGLFTVKSDGTVLVNNDAVSLSKKMSGADERVRMVRIASHLGRWLSTLPVATIFYSLGATP
jgi:hypothetical protein